MKQHFQNKTKNIFPLRTVSVIGILLAGTLLLTSAFKDKSGITRSNIENNVFSKDSVESVKAFMQVYSVLMSPRCMNCHPSGDVPLQGDDSHLHTMLPKRGKDGKGLYAMKCTNCHQPENTLGIHTPPGNPDWHLPPADMKMVFQGRTANQLARQIVDPKQNGNKNIQKLIEHADDALVVAGWHPGEGRTVPPMSHAEFKKAWTTWLTKGAFAPKPAAKK